MTDHDSTAGSTRRVAIVTGGASGLGRAIATRLRDDGVLVTITDIRPDELRVTAAELGIDHVAHDVRLEESWASVIEHVSALHDRLDILVNCAGIFPVDDADPERMTLDAWHRVFAVNLDGVFLGCRAAIPTMARSGGGSIVNISSIAASMATPYASAYGASKAAVLQLTRSIAQHCAQVRNGIRCNAVQPGVVLTPQYRSFTAARSTSANEADAALDGIRSEHPLGELVEADEVGALVAFLVSDPARHITGTSMVIDSGMLGCDTFVPRG